ncbi:MAG: hypothetical protein M1823_003618 [Watsoniomyces obsoletus]|nr:MAG: hypothetical protein M1823_003618 [Watsoniomyces obsoletus]
MNRRATPRLLPVLGAILLVVTIISIFTYFGAAPVGLRKGAIPAHQQSKEPPAGAPTSSTWDFKVERDGDNYSLTDKQCQNGFPLLYGDIEQSVANRRAKPITLEELDARPIVDGMVRGMIYDGDLLLINYEDMHNTFTRALATLQSLHRALIAAPDRRSLPNIEFIFTTEDYAEGPQPVWAYSKKTEQSNTWLMPDFGYWSWPEVKVGSYNKIRHLIADVDEGPVVDGKRQGGLAFEQKTPKLFWRGNVNTAPAIREKLMQVTEGKSWADVKALDWGNQDDIKANLLPMEDHCRYMFLAQTEGRSFSGRGKYLQNCRSVFVAHKMEWKEAHHGALISSGPEANYVEVERDFSNLESKIQHLIEHPEEAERIAENGVRTFRDRYLTPAAEACYWRRLITAWRSVSFEPRLHNDTESKEWRGVPFESFVLTRKLHWDAH